MRRSLILKASFSCVLAGCLTTKQPSLEDRTPTPEIAGPTSELYFIDGREATKVEVEKLPREAIVRIEVIKGSAAVARCGSRSEFGIVDVTTVNRQTPNPVRQEPHYFIDGTRATMDQVSCLAQDNIAQIEVIKGHAAVLYGGEPGVGLVRVTTKRGR